MMLFLLLLLLVVVVMVMVVMMMMMTMTMMMMVMMITKGSLGYLSSIYFSTCGWVCLQSLIFEVFVLEVLVRWFRI